jgi:YVTN family beta-propeller protein
MRRDADSYGEVVMTTMSLGRTISALTLAATACLIAMAPAVSSAAAAAGGPHVVATIGLDRQPYDVATDPATGLVFVTEPFKLVVIDGKTNTVLTSVHVPDPTFAVATDPATGLVYVSDPGHGRVLVISEKTDAVVASIKVGGAFFLAVNPVTDRIYVQAIVSTTLGRVVVIDGRTNKVVARVDDQNNSQAVAADPVTNTVYALSQGPDGLLVIDGRTSKVTATIPSVAGIDVVTDPRTGMVYVASPGGEGPGFVDVINGETHTVTTTVTVSSIFNLAVDRLTNFVYAANYGADTVAVINGRTNRIAASVPVGSHPRDVAVDQQTNTIYVTDTGARSVSVIAGAG